MVSRASLLRRLARLRGEEATILDELAELETAAAPRDAGAELVDVTSIPVPRRSVLEACRSGRLAARKVGRRWLASPAAIDAWLGRGAAVDASEPTDDLDAMRSALAARPRTRRLA